MSINQIVTPLDSAVLETKEQYSVYFRIVEHSFGQLVQTMLRKEICTSLEASFVEQYCALFTYSLEAFRIKYLYDDDEKMRIDLTESGFPNYLEFRYLYNDLELSQEHIAGLPKLADLKADFLETLMKHKREIPYGRLQQAASLVYYTSVRQEYIFKRFVQGKIVELGKGYPGKHLISWAFYDTILNRPFICFMYFDLHKSTVEEYRSKIYEVLASTANRKMEMDMMAYAIDKKLDKLRPKKFLRLDVGPLHSVFAKDELHITHAVLQAIMSKTLKLSAFALSLSVDMAVSTGSFQEGSFFNKQSLQVWAPTEHTSYVLAPHRVIQVLYDKIPETVHSLTQEPIEVPALKLD